MAEASKMQVTDEIAIQITAMNKWYGTFHVLRDINMTVMKGERIVICGPSGSGKSTLIRCINRLEEHQKGSIVVDGVELTADVKRIDEIRREVGMGFQHFNLFPHLTILENLTLAPIWVKKMSRADADATAMKLLQRVKIADQAHKYPGQLSGGQQQRVAIARAMVTQPQILLADEPVASLDPESTRRVMDLLRQLQREQGMTLVISLHNVNLARQYCDRIIALREGRLVYDGPPMGLDNQRLRELYGTHSDELFMDHPPETPEPLFNPTLQLLAH